MITIVSSGAYSEALASAAIDMLEVGGGPCGAKEHTLHGGGVIEIGRRTGRNASFAVILGIVWSAVVDEVARAVISVRCIRAL